MEFLPEWAPNLHPMVVHFPIAILSIAIFFDFASFFISREKKWWTEEATAFLYGIGALAAIVVYYTGTLAADSVMLPARAQPVLTEHANLAWITIWFYGLYAIARIVATWWAGDKHRMKFHIGFFLLSLVGMYFLYQTGDHGSKMVFKYGVGVQTAEVKNPVQHEHGNSHGTGSADHSQIESDSLSAAASFKHTDNGWSWNIERGALSVLREQFQWLAGSAESVNARVTEEQGGHSLSFSGDTLSAFLIGNNSFKTEQVDYQVNMTSFDGTVEFATHVQDKNNYDFVSVTSGGTVKQGRVVEGERKIYEGSTITVDEPLFVRVVGNGTHFRGYINNELVVHGHGDAPPPGKIGLRLNGSGTFLLARMSVSRL